MESKSRVIPTSFHNLDLSVRVVLQMYLVVMEVELEGWVVEVEHLLLGLHRSSSSSSRLQCNRHVRYNHVLLYLDHLHLRGHHLISYNRLDQTNINNPCNNINLHHHHHHHMMTILIIITMMNQHKKQRDHHLGNEWQMYMQNKVLISYPAEKKGLVL